MKRTQISTNVSNRTRQQADELVATLGYSLRDVVSIAVDRMYKEESVTKNTIKDRFMHCNIVHSVEIADGIVIQEWSWIRNGDGGTEAPLGYIGLTESSLDGFRKRAHFFDNEHPGSC